MSRTIEAIQFGPDGIRLTYIGSTDVRAEGQIYQAHTIAVSWNEESVAEQVQTLEEAATGLLEAALKRWATTLPVDLEADLNEALEEQHDDEGLGHG